MTKRGVLGNAIRKARMEKNLSQEELAEIVGITPTHMKHIESGHRNPSVDILFKLTRILYLSLDGLIFDEPESSVEYNYAEILLKSCTSKELKVVIDIIRAIQNNRE